MQNRRDFLYNLGLLGASTLLPQQAPTFFADRKLRIALVGTGIRGMTFWGKRLIDNYNDILEFVGLSDINHSRLAYAKSYMGASCPTFTNFGEMLGTTKPDLVIVTTKDAVHHEYIIKGLNAGLDVLTEKPLTIDEQKCQAILDAERASKGNLIMGFNYRWSPYMTRIKEVLHQQQLGELSSVDFHWYLNTYHGASYFRRWHGQKDGGGTLWIHKATHHFDLLNWWVNSEPEEVFAYGALEHYGSNGPFRGKNCRECAHKKDCAYHWDILKNDFLTKLYVDHEHVDGYLRDNCLFRDEIDIYDKMSAQIKYANGVVVNYSLTTYSPFEGWRIAFNCHKARMEAWQDIPYYENMAINQDALHQAEMAQDQEAISLGAPLIIHPLWEKHKTEMTSMERGGHGGGDSRLQDKIFKNKEMPDPLGHAAGLRDGAMSMLIGSAARKSIETGQAVKIQDLTDLKPKIVRS